MKSSNISLGVGIMAVPERADRVNQLLHQLNLQKESIAWDKEHQGHVYTWWRAIERASITNPSHVLILEDDAEPCQDFIAAVNTLIERFPDRIMSFFTLKQSHEKPDGSLKLFKHYQGFSDLAVVYPRAWLDDLRTDFMAQLKELQQTVWQAGFGADEMRLKLRPQQPVWNTIPSLVQHGSPQHSTLGHRFPRSLAQPFIGRQHSALDLDWSHI